MKVAENPVRVETLRNSALKRNVLSYYLQGELRGNIARYLSVSIEQINYIIDDFYNHMTPLEIKVVKSVIEDDTTLTKIVDSIPKLTMYGCLRILDTFGICVSEVKMVKTSLCYLGCNKKEYDIILRYRKGEYITEYTNPEEFNIINKYLDSIPNPARGIIQNYLREFPIDSICKQFNVKKHKIYIYLKRYNVIYQRKKQHNSIRGNFLY